MSAETASVQSAQRESVAQSIKVGERRRTYRLYASHNLPKDRPIPLVFVFHGGGGDGVGTERLTRFSDVAEREKFIVVYPDGISKNWNDGRDASVSRAHRENIDDVGFVAALIDELSAKYRVDPNRIFATGISNGAIFSHYLAARLSSRIAAIAPVVGGIADPFYQNFNPEQPVSVLILQGTADPLTPYEGGGIAGGRRGKIIPTTEAVRKWNANNGCTGEPHTGTLPDKDPTDGCTVKTSSWSGCRNETAVTLYTLRGAGHTWPGGAQYLPQRIVGKVCRDVEATEVIWQFFSTHPKRAAR
jgi:polyhydroxybutyrate depolymerase